ncbi:MAG: HlyD family efflux transporter periplasmic adaptor subunit [Sulfurimonas sp.]|nr:HlyD family efflux transporter periplasmic adaptor subunit [Sulfurimonas sp.]MBU3939571.1 HlyD family efflux transporter periplasmic adaptor subunit [bacterium]
MSSSRLSQSTEGLAVLSNIKILRDFDGGEEEFWSHYAANILALCKSPAIYIVESASKEDLKWREKSKSGLLEIFQSSEFVEKFLLQNLAKIVQNGYSYEPLNIKIPNMSTPFLLTFSIESDKDNFLIAFIVADRSNTQQFNEMLVRTQLVNDVYVSYKKRDIHNRVDRADQEDIFGVLELLNLIKDEKKFVLACMKLADELCVKFDCSRVSVGWKSDEYINSVAVSHLEKFDTKSSLIKKLQNIYEECADQEQVIVYPLLKDQNVLTLAHEEYIKENSLHAIVSLPIVYNEKIYGVVTLEREDASFSDEEITLLTLTLLQLNVWLFDLYEKDKWLGEKIADSAKNMLSSFFGSENSFAKFAGVIVSALLLYSFFFEWDYKIEVSATLDTDNISYIQAPYDSFVKSVNYFPGDFVAKGETVIELDEEELLLKKLEMESDVIRYSREAEKARAKSELADMNIAIAKVNQAEAALKKVEYYLSHSKIQAPFDGYIVEGDKKELLSSPVSKGDMLLKIANAKDMFIKFKLNEKYIDEIKIHDKGELKLLSKPDTYYPIEVKNIIPIAQVDGASGNIFVLKARSLEEVESWWRPGMSGIAKINVGPRKVIWIITHSTMDFLRVYFWI